MELFKHVGVFANPNGVNACTKSVLKVLAKVPETQISVCSLAEQLPEYTRFPSEQRKIRLEEVLQQAGKSAVEELASLADGLNLYTKESKMLSGRFPSALLDWINSSAMTLLVKESLAADGRYGYASKGDIKLTRQSPIPVLLAHSEMQLNRPVMVPIAPLRSDTTHDRLCLNLIEIGKAWAKAIGGGLHIVSAWELWGESLLNTRMSEEDLTEAVAEERKFAEKGLARIVEQVDFEGIPFEKTLGQGGPNTVLAGVIDLINPALVVMGSVAREGLQGALLGNTAETIARSKQSSVLIVR